MVDDCEAGEGARKSKQRGLLSNFLLPFPFPLLFSSFHFSCSYCRNPFFVLFATVSFRPILTTTWQRSDLNWLPHLHQTSINNPHIKPQLPLLLPHSSWTHNLRLLPLSLTHDLRLRCPLSPQPMISSFDARSLLNSHDLRLDKERRKISLILGHWVRNFSTWILDPRSQHPQSPVGNFSLYLFSDWVQARKTGK